MRSRSTPTSRCDSTECLKRAIRVHSVATPPPLARAREVTFFLEAGHDALDGSLADSHPICHLSEPHPRLPCDAEWHVGVITEQCPPRTVCRAPNHDAPSLDFAPKPRYHFYDLDVVYCLSRFRVPRTSTPSEPCEAVGFIRPGGEFAERSAESHLAGIRRATLESRRSRSERPCPTVKTSCLCFGSRPRWRCWRRCWLRRSRRRGLSPSCPDPIASAAISLYPRANRPPVSAERWPPTASCS